MLYQTEGGQAGGVINWKQPLDGEELLAMRVRYNMLACRYSHWKLYEGACRRWQQTARHARPAWWC